MLAVRPLVMEQLALERRVPGYRVRVRRTQEDPEERREAAVQVERRLQQLELVEPLALHPRQRLTAGSM